ITRSMTDAKEPILLKVVAPPSHMALSGDVTVFILDSEKESSMVSTSTMSTNGTNGIKKDEKEKIDPKKDGVSAGHEPLVLRVLYVDGLTSELIGDFPLDTLPHKSENISVIIPCGVFSRGGIYTLRLQYKFSTVAARYNTAIAGLPEIEMSSALDVKWPTPSLLLESQHFGTYPSQPVIATIKYNGISCVPANGVPVAAYILQLIYCGTTAAACDPQNNGRMQVLYYEEINGFASPKIVKLKCEFFGLAGNYALRLKASDVNPSAPTTSAYIKVEWSDEFSFNVHARSIYPCEGSAGISVLFQYPACRLQGDRVRVYGRLRADVSSLAPPSALHYVAELKAAPGKHSLNFDCDIFTEKFIEYCFIYVSQAITGAMAEVKLACIPTFPLLENDAAGWGPWSAWSPCSSSCVGGVRNRYRFCDTPPPKYGAKFCQGRAVETESCGGTGRIDFQEAWNTEGWECRHGTTLAAARPEVTAQIGAQCRCGCIINFGDNALNKILAANTQACPGRSFWLLQAKSDYIIRLHLDQTQFPCPGQYFRARDGDSLSAELLTDIAFDKVAPVTGTIFSSGQSLLLEFFSDEHTASGNSCVGGFLGHASTFQKLYENKTSASLPSETNSTLTVEQWIFWGPAHLATASLLILIFFISIFLALQFALKYRKYHIAEDLDTLSEHSGCSDMMVGRAKSMSSTTLISEVASLVGLPKKCTPRLSKRKAPCAVEDGYDSSETLAEYEDETSLSSTTLKFRDNEESCTERSVIPNKLHADEPPATVSAIMAIGQPEVKYATPVKLRTLGSVSPANKLTSGNTTRCQSRASITDSPHIARIHRYTSNPLQSKDSSTSSPLSGTSTLRSGKETKDRRNRERLLQGPGSEFSLTNPETDMEIDYYDYNVANAGAAPGSYLGMDPAFLLWIPPLSMSEDSQGPSADCPDCFQGTTTSPALYRLPESTEGATLTPAEYRRMRHQIASSVEETRPSLEQQRQDSTVEETRPSLEQQRQDSTSSSSSRNDSSSASVLSEDSISESRTTRLNEHLLPIHRILEDSRTRVSEESLCSQLAIDRTIPNRLHGTKPDFSQEQSAARSSRQDNYVNIFDGVVAKAEDKSEKSRQAFKRHPEEAVLHHGTSRPHVSQKAKDVSQGDKKNRYFKNENAPKLSSKSTSSKTQGYADGKDRGPQSAKDDPKSDIVLTNLNSTRNRWLVTINMRILNVFGFFGILCINFEQFNAFSNMDIRSWVNGFDGYKVSDLDIVKRNCKNLETLSPLLRLKKHLFCDYDDTVHPNYPKTTNVTLALMPKQMNFKTDNAKLLLHSWMSLTWTDPRLTWTPSDYDDITFIHVKSWEIWTPDLCLNNSQKVTESNKNLLYHVILLNLLLVCSIFFSADMSSDQYGLPTTECLLFNSGSVSCVPVVKFISKCDPDYTYWPYDKHQCRVTFISWRHKGEEVDLLMSGIGVCALIENHLIP
ncbi:Neuronal acetylcholine receptor subunit alpha-5, partial [Temnothorax longispinosus]